jgi:hypothetical protein
MENYYKRIEIKTQADLPKETGNYWSGHHSKGDEMDLRDFNPDMEENESVWNTLDWYLQPCNEKIEALEELCALRGKLIVMLDDILIDGYEHRFNPKGSLQKLRQKIEILTKKIKG